MDYRTQADLVAEVKRFKQDHLLQFIDDLTDDHKTELFDDLRNVDFARLTKAYQMAKQSLQNGAGKKDEYLRPLEDSIYGSTYKDISATAEWRETGLRAIAEGKVAALLLAGGQGTRLGVSYPKGMYDVGLPSHKTLYQIQAERILRLQRLANELTGKECLIPWYIMTSEFTKQSTLEFFKSHDYFGLAPDNVVVFEQNTIPCVDHDGKLMLAEKHHICKAPDGNGGLYAALINSRHNILEDMKHRGVVCIHVYCVDNILVKMADPVFIGFCLQNGAQCGAKVVRKATPSEKVGVICRYNGTYQVVEYSEISAAIAEKRNADGTLTYSAGNICNHYFALDFLQDICMVHDQNLPYHVAEKKIPFLNSAGQKVEPAKPNGIKLEKFVFDVFQFSSKLAVLEVLREDEFSPIKNAPGTADKDTPTTAKGALMDLCLRHIRGAGGDVEPNEQNEIECEISPLVSYFGEGLESICKGKKFKSPALLD